jgi:hypothetical protein
MLKKGSKLVEAGRTILEDIDLKAFFYIVNHNQLMCCLSATIDKKPLFYLIHKNSQSDIIVASAIIQCTEDILQ